LPNRHASSTKFNQKASKQAKPTAKRDWPKQKGELLYQGVQKSPKIQALPREIREFL
jgi:hypothetical protein